jgi:hypothetical protein
LSDAELAEIRAIERVGARRRRQWLNDKLLRDLAGPMSTHDMVRGPSLTRRPLAHTLGQSVSTPESALDTSGAPSMRCKACVSTLDLDPVFQPSSTVTCIICATAHSSCPLLLPRSASSSPSLWHRAASLRHAHAGSSPPPLRYKCTVPAEDTCVNALPHHLVPRPRFVCTGVSVQAHPLWHCAPSLRLHAGSRP